MDGAILPVQDAGPLRVPLHAHTALRCDLAGLASLGALEHALRAGAG